MTAQDNLSSAQFPPGQLFHGSAAELQPGHTVLPSSRAGTKGNSKVASPDHAYATDSMTEAVTFGGMSGFPRVYTVNPVNTASVEHDPHPEVGKGAVRSPDGFKVTGEVPEEAWRAHERVAQQELGKRMRGW